MPEPVDYFLQGASLGMNAVSTAGKLGVEQEQFRTNLAERARQFNAGLDLERMQAEAVSARNNAYARQIDNDIKLATDEFNKQTVQSESLSTYRTALDQAVASNTLRLPMPPSGLTGKNFDQAAQMFDMARQSQLGDAKFRAAVADHEDEMDLISNFQLDPNYQSFGEQGMALRQAAQDRRNTEKADAIAARFGTTLFDLVQSNPKLQEANFLDAKGNINEGLLEGYISKATGLMPISRSKSASNYSYTMGVNPLGRANTDPSKALRSEIEVATAATRLATIPGDNMGEPEYVDAALRNEWIDHFKNPDKYPRPDRSPRRPGSTFDSNDPDDQKIEDILNHRIK